MWEGGGKERHYEAESNGQHLVILKNYDTHRTNPLSVERDSSGRLKFGRHTLSSLLIISFTKCSSVSLENTV